MPSCQMTLIRFLNLALTAIEIGTRDQAEGAVQHTKIVVVEVTGPVSTGFTITKTHPKARSIHAGCTKIHQRVKCKIMYEVQTPC